MGWFFGKSKEKSAAAPQVSSKNIPFSLDGQFLSLPKRGYFGQYCRSPNGRYILTWRDSNDAGTEGGARSKGQGRYILFDQDRIIWEGRLDRPNDGKVADDGTFILNDWHFFSGELRGTFCAFRVTGEPIVKLKFEANLYNNGLSSDGVLACCQTNNSENRNDSSVLTIFDLQKGRELSRWMPESGLANSYSFSPGIIALSYPDGPAWQYSLTGEFLDREKWLDHGLAIGDFRIIETMLKEIPKPISEETVKRLVAGCDIGLRTPHYRDPAWQVIGLRLKGESFDGAGKLSDALQCYEKALTQNPKVGVKRRASQLQKQLSKS